MNRQIYGITLFVVIVSFSVFTYEYFSYSEVTDCASARNEKCAPPREPYFLPEEDPGDHAAEDVAVRLESVIAGIKDRTVKTRLRLEWLGEGAPPKAVWVQLQFHNFDGSGAGWVSEPYRIGRPFEAHKIRVTEPEFACERCHNLPRNLYATVRLWTRSNGEQKLLYEIKGMRPVLVQE